jgi:hypothetical protein
MPSDPRHSPDHEHDDGQYPEYPRLGPTLLASDQSISGEALGELSQPDDPGGSESPVTELSPARAADGLQASPRGAQLPFLLALRTTRLHKTCFGSELGGGVARPTIAFAALPPESRTRP